MSLVLTQLRRIGYGASIGLHTLGRWQYATNDTALDVLGADYFNDAAAYLRKGEVIEAISDLGGTPLLTTMVVQSETGAAPVVVGSAKVTLTQAQYDALPAKNSTNTYEIVG